MESTGKAWATEPIAIIGLSCKFAGEASSPDKLWEVMAEGKSAWSEFPSSRFNLKGTYHPNNEKISTTSVKGAYFMEEDVGLFDAAFFNYSAETASVVDPQFRLQLESCYEALENAGLTLPQIMGSNTSVFAGIFSHDYHEGLVRDEDKLPRFLPIGTFSAMASNRISHFFDLRGASMTLDTGCSTALVALHQAVTGLRTGEADMSIVTGCNLMLAPDMFKVFSSLGMLSADGKSYAFDSRANGYGRGEGVGTIVIKRLSDALAARDPVRAVIRETALNQDGKTETITSPSQAAQEALMRECYRCAGIDPSGTHYFEAHGTGTPTGDPIEARAIANVFRTGREKRQQPLRIGSVKTNIGHTEAASGMAALIKVVLAMEKGQIPPSINFKTPNPKLALDDWNLKVATELEPWPAAQNQPMRASVNNFGYGGSNAHVILEGAETWAPLPQAPDLGIDISKAPVDDKSKVIALSARDEQACARMVTDLKEYLQKRKEADPDTGLDGMTQIMQDLAYTLSERRTRFPWVAAHLVSYKDDLDEVIKDLASPKFKAVRPPTRSPRIGMVFTGQGAQWHAMGRELINGYPVFKAALEETEGHLRELGADWSLMEELHREAATTRVNDTAISIPVCVAVQISLVRLLRVWGITPTAVTSHSSGEIAAAYTVGALSLRQAMAAAYYRAVMAADKKMRGPVQGGMVAVGLGVEDAQGYLDRLTSGAKAVVACINSPSSVTVAGDVDAVQELEELAKAEGVFARRLRVDTGYHSHHMMPIAEPYLKALRAMPDEETKTDMLDSIAFSSAVTGGRITSAVEIADPQHWVGSLVQPVQFVEAFTDMVLGDMDESGSSIDLVLEVGPHTALGGPIKEILGQPEFEGLTIPYFGCLVRKEHACDTMRTMAINLLKAGLPVNMYAINFPRGDWPLVPRVLTDLPSYPWNHTIKHWSEARVNTAIRARNEMPHDLIGHPVAGANTPAWRQTVRLDEIPWLRDHQVQGNILYPGAGFVCMAIEAIKQMEADKEISGYRLRDVDILQALVVPDKADGIEIQIKLTPVSDRTIGARGWMHFEVQSVTPESRWTEHAKGLITVDLSGSPEAQLETIKVKSKSISGYTRRIDPADMFAHLRSLGINHGPLFQNTTDIIQDGKEPRSVATIVVADTSVPKDLPRRHVLHPTTLDSIVLACYSAVPSFGSRDDGPKVPRSIEKLWVSSQISCDAGHTFKCNAALSHADSQSLQGDISVVDGDRDLTVVEVQGLVCQSLGRSSLGAGEDVKPWEQEVCSRVEWAPDLLLRVPASLTAIKKQLSRAPGKTETDMMDLRRVCVYFCDDAMAALTPEDMARLEPHHVKFRDWMQHTLLLAELRRLGPDSDRWMSDTPAERQRRITLATQQSVDGELICHLGPHIASMLRGEQSPIEVMMEDKLLYKYYAHAVRFAPSFVQLAGLLRAVVHKNPRARVLEIGAGTGGATRHMLKAIGKEDDDNNPMATMWHFTDVSSGFFEAARAEFAHYGDLLQFDRLDIERDPASQGFKLASYDIVVACQVLHATKNMARTMANVRSLMRPGGTLLLMETTQDPIDLQFIFGLLPGWWLSEEPERESSPSLSVPFWERVLRGAGFNGIDVEIRDCESDDMYSMSTIMSTVPPARPPKLESDKMIIVTSNKSPPPASWLKSLQASIAEAAGNGPLPAVQALESSEAETYSGKTCVFVGEVDQPILKDLDQVSLNSIRTMTTSCKGLLWVTRGGAVDCENPYMSLAAGFLRSLRNEYVGRAFLTLDLDPYAPVWSDQGVSAIMHTLKAAFGDPHDPFKTAFGEPDDAFIAAPAPDENEYAERNGLIMVPRIFKDVERNQSIQPYAPDWAAPDFITKEPLFQPQRPLCLQVGIPGLLDTLAFDDDVAAPAAHEALPADMVELEPRAYGLNFRDVMVAMGQLRERVMGLECAGIITRLGREAQAQGYKVGDRVMALLLGPMASRARIKWQGLAPMPSNMTFETAASLPMIFETAYHALVDVARLRAGQSVLIHAAAGGVGQAAVMLAKHLGAIVYATVSSPEKRNLLIHDFGIPAERIFNSRDASFAPAVLKATGGRGVDVVLNSLAGPLLQAGFDVLAPLGHFIEIGKRDLEGNSLLEMAPFARHASFTALDLMTLLRHRGADSHRIMAELARLVGQGAIGPVHPVTVYPMSDVAKAFRLLQTGKHMGKVVLSVGPQEEVPVLPRVATARLRSDASYLLVGGAGGLGRSIAHWMVDHGARNIILLSRSAGKIEKTGGFVSELREAGCRVMPVSCDVSNAQDLTKALRTCEQEGLPQVKGVVQGAMALKDSILEQMTLADWQTAIRPKVQGTWNLHAQYSSPGSLDFFIMLSSLSGIFGIASQSNYSAGGAYEDAMAQFRRAHGLPAVSIDLGAVKGVGYVAETAGLSQRMRKMAQTLMLAEDEVLRVLDNAIRDPFAAQIVLGLNTGPGTHWEAEGESQMGRDARFLPLKYRKGQTVGGKNGGTGADASGEQALSVKLVDASSRDEAAQLVGDAIATKLADIFMISTDEIDLTKPPAQYGVDSLVAVELRNMLVLEAAAEVSIFSILQCASLAALATEVVASSALVA